MKPIRDTGVTLLGYPVFESDEIEPGVIAFGDGKGESVHVRFTESTDAYFRAICHCGLQFTDRLRWTAHSATCCRLLALRKDPL